MTVSRYANLTRGYYETYLPSQVAKMTDPEKFYRAKGREMAARVRTLTPMLAGPDRDGESYLDKVGRLTEATKAAEEKVLGEDLFALPKELGTEDKEPPVGPIPGVVRVQ